MKTKDLKKLNGLNCISTRKTQNSLKQSNSIAKFIASQCSNSASGSTSNSSLTANLKSTNSTTKSAIQSTTKSTTQSTTKSTTQSNSKSTTQLNSKPTIQSNSKPTIQSNSRPTIQSTTKSTTQSNSRPTIQSTTQSTTQPTSQSTANSNQRISKINGSQPVKLKLNLSNETNITNFYQQKKRLHLNNDSFDSQEDSPNKKRKMQNNLPIINWDTPNTPNTNVDFNLKITIDSTINSTINSTTNTTNQQQNDSSSHTNLKRPTHNRIDQMLDDFHAKLQFNSLTKTPDKVDTVQMNSDLDGMLNDEWTLSNAPEELRKIECMINPLKSTKDDLSKESGISSCTSIDLKKQTNSPLIVDSKPSTNQDQFKIPETPIKNVGRLGRSKLETSVHVQFFSTPKVVARQQNKINQSLNFKGISPIKGSCNENSLINIKSENKRQLNDSVDQDSLMNKKRNGKVLFQSKAVEKNDEFEFEDDSFDIICSQFDDKELLKNKKTVNTKLNSRPNQPIKPVQSKVQSKVQSFAQRNQVRTTRTQPANELNRRPFHSQTSNGSTMSSISSKSNSPASSSQYRQSTASSMSTRSKTTTKSSSIQFTDDSSNIFAVESPINRAIKKPVDDSINDFLMNDEDDLICSQVVV